VKYYFLLTSDEKKHQTGTKYARWLQQHFWRRIIKLIEYLCCFLTIMST